MPRPFRPLSLLLLALLLVACGSTQATPTLPRPATATAPATAGETPTATTGLPGTSPTLAIIVTPTGTLLITATPGGGGAEAGTNWTSAGSLASARFAHTASLLPDGRVLVVGGEGAPTAAQSALTRAEIFDPALNVWSEAGAMSLGRRNQTATVLKDGSVLVVGGELGRGGAGTSATTPGAELFDVGTNSWRTLAPAAASRSGHTATLLPDGRVLVVGGFSVAAEGAPAQSVGTAEIFDPASGSWSPAGSLSLARSGHTASLLPDGRVLVVGGEARAAAGAADLTASAEIYDPASNSWTRTGSLATGRSGHTATPLGDGRVLVVGGQTDLSRGGNAVLVAGGLRALAPSSGAEVFDPATNGWRPIASLASERSGHTATLLPDGKVLVIGGVGRASDAPLATAERYDPATDRWTVVAAPTARAGHTATLLPDGAVLVVGGKGTGGTYLASAERYSTGLPRPATPTAIPTAAATATAPPTATPTPVPIAPPPATTTPTSAATRTPTGTAIPAPATATPSPAIAPPTVTPTGQATTPTNTPAPSARPATNTPTPAPTPTNTPRPPTNTPTATNTPVSAPGAVYGTVRGCYAGVCNALSGVTVSAGGRSTTTSGGSYTLASVPAGNVTVTVSGAVSGSKGATVPAGGRVQVDFDLDCTQNPTACGFKP